MPASSQAGIIRGNALTGSRVQLQIKQKVIGYATIASYNESIGHEPITPLDQMDVAEWVPVSYDVSFTASRVAVAERSLKDINIMPAFGQSSEEFLLNIIAMGEMTADLIDQIKGPIIRLQGVKVISHGLTYAARSLVGEDVDFVARRVTDASEGL